MKNQKGISLISLIIIIVIILFALVLLFGKNSNNNTDTENPFDTSSNLPEYKTYGLGDTIIFDGLSLTFDSTYSFDTLSNSYSDYNGSTVIKLGVTVKNISTETNHLNMFSYDLFGSQGIELDGVSAYFDENIDFAGDLKPGASYKSYFHILYDGDGNYSIDFDNYSQKVSVEFKVIK